MSLYRRIVLFFTLLPFAAGCGDVMTTYYKGVSTAAMLAKTCREELSAVHAKKTALVTAKTQAGDVAGAKITLDGWLPIYDKVKKTCEGVKIVAEEALVAAPVVEAAVTKKKDALGWITRLAQLGFDTVAVLTEAGIKIPGGK